MADLADPLQEPEVQAEARPQVTMRSHLTLKLPEILLEAASVVFAILLAFGVDQYREEQSHAAAAARARQAILAELRANRDELKGMLADNDKAVRNLQEQLRRLTKGEVHSLSTHMQLANLSGAAFGAAQSTQALQFLDFNWLVLVGRTYELQRTYTTSQEVAVQEVGASGGAIEGGEKPLTVLHRVNSRMTTVQQLGGGLMQAYDEVLAK